jgi:hypothetical protein
VKSISLLAALTICVAGCASSKQLVWSGPKTIEGTGAIGEVVDGIYWYEAGVPEGTWEVLGAVGTEHYTGGNLAWNAMAASSARGKSIRAAKALGGTAVVFWSGSAERFGGGPTVPKAKVQGTRLVVRPAK